MGLKRLNDGHQVLSNPAPALVLEQDVIIIARFGENLDHETGGGVKLLGRKVRRPGIDSAFVGGDYGAGGQKVHVVLDGRQAGGDNKEHERHDNAGAHGRTSECQAITEGQHHEEQDETERRGPGQRVQVERADDRFEQGADRVEFDSFHLDRSKPAGEIEILGDIRIARIEASGAHIVEDRPPQIAGAETGVAEIEIERGRFDSLVQDRPVNNRGAVEALLLVELVGGRELIDVRGRRQKRRRQGQSEDAREVSQNFTSSMRTMICSASCSDCSMSAWATAAGAKRAKSHFFRKDVV